MAQTTGNNPQPLTEYEVCSLCKEILHYPKETHIDDPRRNGHYIEGAGQLCDECYDTVFNASHITLDEQHS